MVRSYYIEGFKNQFEESKIGIMKKVDKIKKKKTLRHLNHESNFMKRAKENQPDDSTQVWV